MTVRKKVLVNLKRRKKCPTGKAENEQLFEI